MFHFKFKTKVKSKGKTEKSSKVSKQYLFKKLLWMENYCEEENDLFFNKKLYYVASLFKFFEKVRAICEFRF